MYRENENSTRHYSDEYEQQIINRQRTRAALRRKKIQRQRRIFFGVIITLILALIIVVCVIIFKPRDTGLDLLTGVWKYDEYTQYEFDGSGNGCMCLDTVHYEYTYSVSGDKVKLDFKDDAVHDCTYSFTIKEDNLTLVGEDGTVGGTYNLTKQ